MPQYKTQPPPLVSVEHAKDAMRIKESGDAQAFERWCSDHASMVVEALRAWAALEYVMARTSIEGLTWYSHPGEYAMRTLDTPSCVFASDEQWQWPTLHETICAAAADFAADEEGA